MLYITGVTNLQKIKGQPCWAQKGNLLNLRFHMRREKRDPEWLPVFGNEEDSGVRGRVPSHRRLLKQRLLLIMALLSTSLWILFQIDLNLSLKNERIRFPREFVNEANSPGFVINTQGCRIQNLDAFDPSIAAMVHKETEPECNRNGQASPVRSTVDSLYVDPDALKIHFPGIALGHNVSCCYRHFWRETYPPSEDYPPEVDRSLQISQTCVPFYEPVKIPHEFIEVSCSDSSDNTTSFEDYFGFAQPPEYYESDEPIPSPASEETVNVLILGIDALSRLNFYRQIPSVMTFLEKRGFVELLGYNKVGDNTFPNLMPLLTGMTEQELGQICWKGPRSVFDDCYFVWNHYKNRGYFTGFGEDSVDIGLFHYLKLGFREKPTDFYSHPYHLRAEAAIGHELWLNCKLCVGKRYAYQLVLDDLLSFAMNMKNVSNFGFFWINSISHDYLNLPRYMNFPLLSVLEQLESNGVLDTTVVILMSDHGIRWGDIRATYQGYVEERLPGMFMLFPRWFREKYDRAYANIKQNRRRLTTPFDVHETLLDLANLSSITDESISGRSQTVEPLKRGMSLFLPVPGHRTCQDAGISMHWCTCRKAKPIPLRAPIVGKLAATLVNYINNLLTEHRQCTQLTLHKIKQTRVEVISVAKNEHLDNMPSKDYIITIETDPGRGNFEATIRASANFTIIPPVSRINTYGDQSACVTDFHLKLYCYCSNNISESA